jgi:hypothetical protein
MNKAEELIEKYNLKPDSYYHGNFNPYLVEYKNSIKHLCNSKTDELQNKFKHRIPKGWYGFKGLGCPTPLEWFKVLNQFLEYVEEQCPDFEIYQIKVKFGGIRIYLGNISEEIQQDISKLTGVMIDAKLVY